ncbi:uncharacterized protein [Aegilops tauschii subsp. strangulata]|uniref:uncharacterized protein n=1 Tax=Aegilops tauschii subsp. strangulata TaxID=200361 RepID=UPI000989E74D|nr:uncharacterized protein LOC109780511 [Aegilops tauschii subsp. strangulata]
MCANSTTSSKEQRTRVFIASANAVLKQCGATAVEEFQIKFPFDNLLVDHLNNWVKFAVLSRAKNLAIELEPEDLRCCKHRHVFPFELFDKQSMSRLEVFYLPEVVTKFSHLKYLQLRLYFSGQDNLLSLASFLKAAPLLEELDIHFQRRSFPLNDFEKLPIRSLPPCRHGHLKRVLITGFHGARGEIELAAHVADNSTRLQALVIDPVMRDVDRNMPALTPEGRAMYWDLARKNAKKYLARRVAQGARFDVL